jgi:hypothetical protein
MDKVYTFLKSSGRKSWKVGFQASLTTHRKVKVKFTEDLPFKLAEKAGPFLILPFLIE